MIWNIWFHSRAIKDDFQSHFFVIFCKLWELFQPVNIFINKGRLHSWPLNVYFIPSLTRRILLLIHKKHFLMFFNLLPFGLAFPNRYVWVSGPLALQLGKCCFLPQDLLPDMPRLILRPLHKTKATEWILTPNQRQFQVLHSLSKANVRQCLYNVNQHS